MMTGQPKFLLEINQFGSGVIKLDGEELSGVVGIDIHIRVGEPPRISIEFLAGAIGMTYSPGALQPK